MSQYPNYPEERPTGQPAQPADPWADTIPQETPYAESYRRQAYYRRRRQRPQLPFSCLAIILVLALIGSCLGVYLLSPGQTNILLLGIDYTRGQSFSGRSDTIILATVKPLESYVGLLSIPRDLWVNIPGVGPNRINTAHFFAESQAAGSGAEAALQTVGENFGVKVGYYVRIRFDGFREVVEALGGVDINLVESMAGYEPGKYHLTSNKALAFVRHRQGSDDFFRMENGQFMLKAVLKEMANPLNWPRLPGVLVAIRNAIDTNVPALLWPRLGFALLRSGASGIDSRTITREMVTPFITDEGADVLNPNWSQINPVLLEMFGQ